MNYFDKKFEEINDFIKQNKQYLENNPDYNKKVKDRITKILILASYISENQSVDQITKQLEALNLDGLIKMYSKVMARDFYIDLNKKLKDDKVPSIGSDILMTIKQFRDELDAEIIDIS